jgi:uncharacterized RDD family membrane protein YckC
MTHNYQTAPLAKRVIAFFIDLAIVGMIVSAFLFFTMGKTPAKLQASGDEGKPSLMDKYQFFAYFEPIALDPQRAIYLENFLKKYSMEAVVGLFLLPLLYFALLEGTKGATIGKMMTGIRVRRKDGGKINLMGAVVRHFGRLISATIFMLGFLLAFIDGKRQTLHDKIANTMVLKKGTGI